jgi:hypothetical protein
MLQAVTPNYPVKSGNVPWAVGDTFKGTLVLANFTLTTPADVFINVGAIHFTPSCGAPSADYSTCNTRRPGQDPGVFEISRATGSGACSGRTFAISTSDVKTGELKLTPSSAFQLGRANVDDAQLICTISFDVKVLKVPTRAANGVLGQTFGLARAAFSSDTPNPQTSHSSGMTKATVQRARRP